MLPDPAAQADVHRDAEDVDFESAVEMFFREPPSGGVLGWVSPLCLCRQELQDCFVGQIVGEDHIFDHPPHRLFASAMVALSGVELLARMVPMPSASAGSGDLFVGLITKYSILAKMPIGDREAKVLLGLRNALSHTFGLYTEHKNRQHAPLELYSSNHPEPVVSQRPDGTHEIRIESLVIMFLRIVQAVREDILHTPDMRPAFLAAYGKYGKLYHRGPHVG